ncbi:MAG: hypothetical protein IJW54_07520 [Clostridia bacterium]|nr:hypothetical protein [Clostridia bacterium]
MYNCIPEKLHLEQSKKIKPELCWNRGDDISLHREKCKEKLKELLGFDTFEKCEPDIKIVKEEILNGSKHIHFLVQTEIGYYANCHLLFPKEYNGDKLPLCVCLQGHVSGAHLGLGIRKYDYDEAYITNERVDFCVQAIERGFIALAIEQRGFGENGGEADTGHTRCVHASMGAILLGRCLIGERVWDVMRVLDATLEHFDNITLDGSLLIGMSGGGTATYYTACLEDRFSAYAPSVALCSFSDSIIRINHCACNYVPKIAKYFDMGDLAIMIAPKKLIIVSGTEDKWFPYEGAVKEYQKIEQIYKALGKSDCCSLVTGIGDHRYYTEAWGAIMKMLK